MPASGAPAAQLRRGAQPPGRRAHGHRRWTRRSRRCARRCGCGRSCTRRAPTWRTRCGGWAGSTRPPRAATRRWRKPDFANGYNILGVIRAKQNRLDEALTYYDRAIALDADFPEAHFHRGLVLLVKGDLAEGLREYEWRLQCVSLGMHRLPGPLWDGTRFPGRTLLLHAEQGLGDTVMFIRYAALVKQRGGTVLFSCPAPLLPLLSGCAGVDGFTVAGAQVDGVHLHASLLSLPYLLGTTPQTIPAEVPYLYPAEERIEHWRQQLAGIRGFKVGLVWQGNAQHPEDRVRSIRLERFAPLARIPGVRLIGMQVGAASDQVRDVAGRFDILDLASRMDQTPGALLDAAAVVRNLDLLISVDTALVHVAGRWRCRCGWRRRSRRTGAGCWTARIRRGIRRCGCSAHRRRRSGSR